MRVLSIGVLPNPRHYNLWGQTFPDHRSPGAQSHLGGHSGAPSQTSWGAALPTAHSRAALAVPTSQGLSPPGKADTGVSHKVGGLSKLTWLNPGLPSGLPPLPSALPNSLATFTTPPTPPPAFPPGKKAGFQTYHFGALFMTINCRSRYSNGLGVLVGRPGDKGAQTG